MTSSRFGREGELLFDVELVSADKEPFPVEVLLDTGFTTGWLAVNSQDLEALQWSLLATQIEMQTARGKELFDLYEGKVIIDEKEFTVAVHVGEEIPEILMGTQWLEFMELVVNKPQGVLTLNIVESEK